MSRRAQSLRSGAPRRVEAKAGAGNTALNDVLGSELCAEVSVAFLAIRSLSAFTSADTGISQLLTRDPI
jgi:hypothetical protein